MDLVLVSTFPPRRCGLASYTSDLSAALRRVVPHWRVSVCATDRDGLSYAEPTIRIDQDEPRDYVRAADAIAARGADLVLIEHEFGIFGGAAGAHILALTDRLAEHGIPYAVTLHTVLAEYTPAQSAALRPLCAGAVLITVFTETARRMIVETGVAEAERVVVVPHGAPEVLRSPIDPSALRPEVAAAIEAGRDTTTLSTFGLIGPGKGLEAMLRALPRIVARHPGVRYLIAGATHPEEVRRHGERYRHSLVDLAEQLGVVRHVEFVDAFLTETELAALLAATDIYVTPYRGAEQTCSGALTFAIAAGRPVVSTAYRYALDLLSAPPGQDPPGLIAACDDDAGLADAVIQLLDDPERRARIQDAADALGRQLTWPAVAARLAEILETTRAGRGGRPEPAVRLDHLARLVDPGGIIQFAHGEVPDRASGSCVDDVARLGIVAAGVGSQTDRAHRWLDLTVDFLADAIGPGGMRNLRDLDGTWRDEPHLGDHVGRAIWGLGTISACAVPHAVRAGQLLRELLVFVPELTSARSLAYALLGLARVARPGREHRTALAEAAGRLDAMRATSPAWEWYEDELTYDNARLPQSLLAAGTALDDPGLTARALARLDWYLGQVGLTGPDPVLRCVGNRWRRSGEDLARVGAQPDEGDEQPLDAAAVVEALVEAWQVTRAPRYARLAHRARAWFHGLNRAGLPLYDPATGGCHDGLSADSVNPNMGAESTLAVHQALLALGRAGLVRVPRSRGADGHAYSHRKGQSSSRPAVAARAS